VCNNLIHSNTEFKLVTRTPTPPKITYLIPDTGCTGHYVNNDVTLSRCTPANLKIRMPDGRHITAAEQGQLPLIQDISQNAAVAYKIPLLSQSLLSIGKLCDNNCTATFSKTDCVIKHNEKIIITGKRDPTNSLWKIPIERTKIRHDPPISEGAQKIEQNRKILLSRNRKMNYNPRPISEGDQIANTRKILPRKQKFPVNYQHPISKGVNSISYVEKVTENITKPKNVMNNLEQIRSK
jgi:hypothetical protein